MPILAGFWPVIILARVGEQMGLEHTTREIARALPDGAFGISLRGRIEQLMAKSVANHS